jgi:hypothetical protein
MLGLVVSNGKPFIVGIQKYLSEGCSHRLMTGQLNDLKEACRSVLLSVRQRFGNAVPTPPIKQESGFGIFSETLVGQSMLLNNCLTVQRHESKMLPTGCVVFSDRPVQRRADGSLYFAVRVDQVESFVGFPILGFTRQRPQDNTDFWPVVSKYMGASVLVGACGEAFARDRESNLRPGFRPPPKDDLETWMQENFKCVVNVGDKLSCLYSTCGSIQLLRNDEVLLEFDTGRTIRSDTDYYAVIDVCFSVSCVTLLPGPAPFWDAQEEIAKNYEGAVSTCDNLCSIGGCEHDDEESGLEEEEE